MTTLARGRVVSADSRGIFVEVYDMGGVEYGPLEVVVDDKNIRGAYVSGDEVLLASMNKSQADDYIILGHAFQHDGVVTPTPIPDGFVETGMLADGSVTEPKIANGAVTDPKIVGMAATKLTGTIPAERFGNATVSNTHIVDLDAAKLTGTLNIARIADSSITTAKYANDSVTDAKIGGMSATKLTGTIAKERFGANTVPSTAVENLDAAKLTGSINEARFGASSIPSSAVQDLDAAKLTGTIDIARIGDDSIPSGKMTSLDAGKLTGSIPTARFGENTIPGTAITSLDAAKLTGTLNIDRLADSSVTSLKIAQELSGKTLTGPVIQSAASGNRFEVKEYTPGTYGLQSTTSGNAAVARVGVNHTAVEVVGDIVYIGPGSYASPSAGARKLQAGAWSMWNGAAWVAEQSGPTFHGIKWWQFGTASIAGNMWVQVTGLGTPEVNTSPTGQLTYGSGHFVCNKAGRWLVFGALSFTENMNDALVGLQLRDGSSNTLGGITYNPSNASGTHGYRAQLGPQLLTLSLNQQVSLWVRQQSGSNKTRTDVEFYAIYQG